MDDAAFRRRYAALRALLNRRSRSLGWRGEPKDLRDGCSYVLGAGGKRVRSVLLVLSCEAVGGSAAEALDAGFAVEALHNFTLVHDDIMDHASSRRGRPTVHMRWDTNTALLVGDVLLGLAYRSLLGTRSGAPGPLARLMTDALLDVCEGQALDMEYERRNDVTIADYFRMIEKKTGRLIAAATEMGAVIGGGTPAQVRALKGFGQHLGLAFQLQDDLLDVVASEHELGKPVGGDIVEGKKTFLLLTAAARARGKDRSLLGHVLRRTAPGMKRTVLVNHVTEIYRRHGVLEDAQHRILRETRSAVRMLGTIPPSEASAMLAWFAGALVHRAS